MRFARASPLARPAVAEFAEQRKTAAGVDGLPGDVACLIGSEKREHAGNPFRCSNASKRNMGFDMACSLGAAHGSSAFDVRYSPTAAQARTSSMFRVGPECALSIGRLYATRTSIRVAARERHDAESSGSFA